MPAYRHIGPAGRLLPAYGVCPGIRAIDNPRPARQARSHPRGRQGHGMQVRCPDTLRLIPFVSVSIPPWASDADYRAPYQSLNISRLSRDFERLFEKVSITRADGRSDEILRFLDASSMMVSREKAWNFNDSWVLAICDASCGILKNHEIRIREEILRLFLKILLIWRNHRDIEILAVLCASRFVCIAFCDIPPSQISSPQTFLLRIRTPWPHNVPEVRARCTCHQRHHIPVPCACATMEP